VAAFKDAVVIKWPQKVAVVSDDISSPNSRTFTFRGHNARDLGESTPPSPTACAGAQKRKARDTLWRRRLNSARAAGRGRVLEGMT